MSRITAIDLEYWLEWNHDGLRGPRRCMVTRRARGPIPSAAAASNDRQTGLHAMDAPMYRLDS